MDNRTAELARAIIDDFSIDPGAYRRLTPADALAMGIHVNGGDLPELYHRGDSGGQLSLTIRNAGNNNRLFLNGALSGDISLGFSGSDSVFYAGRDVHLAEQHIGSRQDGDVIAVGNDVRSTGPGRWISGLRAGPARPALVIGDCCVVSRDVVLRNSDGHPVMDASLEEQVNAPHQPLLIEPHAWLGERCAILKGVTVGAFARIAFGAVVTRAVPRHHTAAGIPAAHHSNEDSLWTWDDSPEGIERAREFLRRYPLPAISA